MIKYIKGDPIRIISFVIAIIICIFIAKGMLMSGKQNIKDVTDIFCDGFINASEEKINLESGKKIYLSDESKASLRSLFYRNISINNIENVFNDNGENIQNSENIIDVVTGIMTPEDKLLYENFMINAIDVAKSSG